MRRKISSKERARIKQRVESRNERLRKRYPEVHGKTLDFVSYAVEEQTLFITLRFDDGADFSLRFTCELSMEGAELCEVKDGNFRVLRHYGDACWNL